MKKVVFKGTINGDVFDNVKDYNERMSELINSGETKINASSTTSVFEEDEIDTDSEKVLFDLESFIPYFNPKTNGHYLDSLISDNKADNAKALEDTKTMLYEKFKELHKLLTEDDVTNDDALELAQNVKDIRECINNDQKINDEGIGQVKKDIDGLEKQLFILQEASSVISLLKNYYDSVWGDLRKYLLLK